jgi:hypothetical protein
MDTFSRKVIWQACWQPRTFGLQSLQNNCIYATYQQRVPIKLLILLLSNKKILCIWGTPCTKINI